MELVRINKFLAQSGVASRREIDRMIERGEITINGKKASTGDKVSTNDIIEVKGKKINSKEKKVYFLLHKPQKVLSASKDDRGRKTVVDFIPSKERLFPIGRLDYNTEGAIILTNDGDIYNKVIHPKSEIYKEYFAIVRGKLEKNDVRILSTGVELEDGITLPAKVELLKSTRDCSELKISIREGRNRQIRRMLEKIGHPVTYLKREKIGEITLGELEKGHYRELTKMELKYLHNL